MSIFFKKQTAHSLNKKPQRKGEAAHNQYGKAERHLVVCKECHNVLFTKEWHRPGVQLSRQIILARKKGVHFILCPACTMKRNGSYEGEIIIERVPVARGAELINLIVNFAATAVARDPQDRVIEIKKRNNGYRVTTTENELAVKLAKRIHSAFKKVKVQIGYSREPYEVARVKVVFC